MSLRYNWFPLRGSVSLFCFFTWMKQSVLKPSRRWDVGWSHRRHLQWWNAHSFSQKSVRSTSNPGGDQGPIHVAKCQTVFFFCHCSALKEVYSMRWASQSLFLGQTALLCLREAEIHHIILSNWILHLQKPNMHILWLSLSSASTGAWKKKIPAGRMKLGIQRMEMSNAARAATVKPRITLMHAWPLNAKLIVIHSCLKWFGNH